MIMGFSYAPVSRCAPHLTNTQNGKTQYSKGAPLDYPPGSKERTFWGCSLFFFLWYGEEMVSYPVLTSHSYGRPRGGSPLTGEGPT